MSDIQFLDLLIEPDNNLSKGENLAWFAECNFYMQKFKQIWY